MRWVAVVAVAVAVAGVGWLTVWAIGLRDEAESACAAAGGVAVKSHLGPMVCIDRDAIIPAKEWRP